MAERRKFRRGRLMSDINIVPYLDVMLVLLVIFMVTAPLFNQGTVDLPNAADAGTSRSGDALEVRIAVNGDLCVAGGNVGGEKCGLSTDEMVAEIKSRKLLNPDLPVMIAGAGKSFYEQIVAALDSLYAAGVTDIDLLVETAPQ